MPEGTVLSGEVGLPDGTALSGEVGLPDGTVLSGDVGLPDGTLPSGAGVLGVAVLEPAVWGAVELCGAPWEGAGDDRVVPYAAALIGSAHAAAKAMSLLKLVFMRLVPPCMLKNGNGAAASQADM